MVPSEGELSVRNLSSASVAPVERVAVDVRVGLGTRLVASMRTGALAFDIVVVTGVALVLGLVRLGAPSLWFDEAFTAEAVHRSPKWWFDNDQYHVLYDSVERA